MARAIVFSGSYMLYERHGAIPDSATFDAVKLETPNYSGRMDNLRATLLRSQMPDLERNCERWNERYQAAESALAKVPSVALPKRHELETYVGSSIQFRVPKLSTEQIPVFIDSCMQRGVELKWFGSKEPLGFTSRYDSWEYLEEPPRLSQTLEILATTFDIRIPLTFDTADMQLIAEIIGEVLADIAA